MRSSDWSSDVCSSDLRVLIPFIVITLIWGSTWIVIKDQLGAVPPTWSVTYRFIIAGAPLFAYARATRQSLIIGREGHALAALLGLLQFFLNYNFVYASEQHLTSGLVAVIDRKSTRLNSNTKAQLVCRILLE